MSADAIAHMVQHICVPQSQALMGIALFHHTLRHRRHRDLDRDLQILAPSSKLTLSDKVKM